MRPRISIEPRSVVLPADGELYVWSKFGAVTLRAKNIDRVHSILLPFLDGNYDEDTLKKAVDSGDPSAVTKYLSALRNAGVLHEQADENPVREELENASVSSRPAAGALGRECASASIMVEGRCVYLSLTDAVYDALDRHDACIFFIAHSSFWRELLVITRWLTRGKSVYFVLVEDPNPDAIGLDQRAAFARWLIGTGAHRLLRNPGSLQISSFTASAGTLKTVVSAQCGSRSELQKLPEKFGVIQAVDIDQAPLAVVRAGGDFFPVEILRFGVRHDLGFYEDVLCEFASLLFRAISCEEGADRNLPACTNGAGPDGNQKAQDPAKRHTGSICARSILAVRGRLLEWSAFENSSPVLINSDTDLVAEESTHPDIAYLRSVLQLRVESAPARLSITKDQLFVYEIGARCHFSFLREKALRDALLCQVWDVYYRHEHLAAEPVSSCDFESFLSRSELRRLIRLQESALGGDYSEAVRNVKGHPYWGRKLWSAPKPDDRKS